MTTIKIHQYIYYIIFFTLIYQQTTFNFLDVASNPRELSFSKGGLAIERNYLSFNPASIYVNKYGIQFSKHILPANIFITQISNTINYNQQMFFMRIKSANYGTLKDAITLSKFTANDIVYEIGHKFIFNKFFSIGYTGGYIKSSIQTFQSEAIFISIGVNKKILNNRLGIAMAKTHLGMQFRTFNNVPEHLPSANRLGVYYKPKYLSAKIFFDSVQYLNQKKKEYLYGIEFYNKKIFIFRISTTSHKKELHIGKVLYDLISGASIGIGIKVKNYNLECSLQNLGPAGTIIGTSITYIY